jgi:hypothetical protein
VFGKRCRNVAKEEALSYVRLDHRK